MPEKLVHLVKVPLRADKLVAVARRRGISSRDLDEGYLAHCLLRDLWQEIAPAPFVLRPGGRSIDVWGYSGANREALVERARSASDPDLVSAISDMNAIASKAVPRLENGKRVGFLLRACPVVRLAKGRADHRAGAEIDAFLARCFEVGSDQPVDREAEYRSWLAKKLGARELTGAAVGRIAIASFTRERLVRRTQSENRQAHTLERPDVRFEGEIIVKDGHRFMQFLAHGIGRHRAFGFGALILVPPGTPYPQA